MMNDALKVRRLKMKPPLSFWNGACRRRTGKAKGRSLFFAIEGDKTKFLMFLWRLSSWKNWTAAEGNASIQQVHHVATVVSGN